MASGLSTWYTNPIEQATRLRKNSSAPSLSQADLDDPQSPRNTFKEFKRSPGSFASDMNFLGTANWSDTYQEADDLELPEDVQDVRPRDDSQAAFMSQSAVGDYASNREDMLARVNTHKVFYQGAAVVSYNNLNILNAEDTELMIQKSLGEKMAKKCSEAIALRMEVKKLRKQANEARDSSNDNEAERLEQESKTKDSDAKYLVAEAMDWVEQQIDRLVLSGFDSLHDDLSHDPDLKHSSTDQVMRVEQLLKKAQEYLDNKDQDLAASAFRTTLRLMENLLERATLLDTEFVRKPDFLVGVGKPGNVHIEKADEKFRQKEVSGESWFNWAQTDIKLEWYIRTAVASLLSNCLVLFNDTYTPWYCAVWIPVLALATAKPVLGDQLHGWWDALAGGFVGWLVALPSLFLVPSGDKAWCLLGMVVSFTILSYTFGDHIQGRWSLLPPTVAMVLLANGKEHMEAFNAIGVILWGFTMGGCCSFVALVLPFPRTASSQVRERLQDTYRKMLRLHAVLVVRKYEDVSSLEMRAKILHDGVVSSMENAERLIKNCEWEPQSWLGDWYGNGSQKLRLYHRHYAMMKDLAQNLNTRFYRRGVKSSTVWDAAAEASASSVEFDNEAFIKVQSSKGERHAEMWRARVEETEMDLERNKVKQNMSKGADESVTFTAWAAQMLLRQLDDGVLPPKGRDIFQPMSDEGIEWHKIWEKLREGQYEALIGSHDFCALSLKMLYGADINDMPEPKISSSQISFDESLMLALEFATLIDNFLIDELVLEHHEDEKGPYVPYTHHRRAAGRTTPMTTPMTTPILSHSEGPEMPEEVKLAPDESTRLLDPVTSGFAIDINSEKRHDDYPLTRSHQRDLNDLVGKGRKGTSRWSHRLQILFPEIFIAAWQYPKDNQEFPFDAKSFVWTRFTFNRFLETWKLVLSLTAASALYWIPTTSDFVETVPLFAPITVIFLYQQRQGTFVPTHSRMWRWTLGTFIGSIYAFWVMYSAAPAAGFVWADDEVSKFHMAVMLAILAVFGATVQASPFFGYAGLVAGFTGPILAIGYDWKSKVYTQDAMIDHCVARLAQSANACFIVMVTTYAWNVFERQSARTWLKFHIAASMRGIKTAMSDLTMFRGKIDTALFCDEQALFRDDKWAQRHLHITTEIQHMMTLQAEAAEEPDVFWRKKHPQNNEKYMAAIQSIETMWRCLLRMYTYEERYGSRRKSRALMSFYRPKAIAVLSAVESVLEALADEMDPFVTTELEAKGQMLAPPEAAFLNQRMMRFVASIDTEFDKFSQRYCDMNECEIGESPDLAKRAYHQDMFAISSMLNEVLIMSQGMFEFTWRLANVLQLERKGHDFLSPENPTDMYQQDYLT